MKSESEAHYTLSKLVKDIGVPNNIIMDNAQAQVRGQFRKKTRKADCRVKQSTELHTLFSNAADSAIRELKTSTGRKLTASGCPKRP